jgi:hypothetical protein
MRTILALTVGSLLAWGVPACSGGSDSPGAGDGGDDAGADTDTDSDADADSDTDTDADSDTDADAGTGLTAEIVSPTTNTIAEDGSAWSFAGIVTDPSCDETALAVTWSSSKDGVLGTSTPDAAGNVSLDAGTLTPGYHTITLSVTNPAEESAEASIVVGVCTMGIPEDFHTDIEGSGWTIYGDAYWDPGGWLEMTGLYQSMKGAIFNTGELIAPGDLSMSFDIYTGPNDLDGADGFALSIFNAADVAELEAIIAAAAPGGGLGYGVAGGDGSSAGSCLWGDMTVEAFHIEFDTWQNITNGVECHTDPTAEDHIAITLNGDPADHVLWAAVGNIEDSAWHTVTVDVVGDNIVITLDGSEIIDDAIPGYAFKGGYLGFSGVTGYYMNYHRFDNLSLLEECTVPAS